MEIRLSRVEDIDSINAIYSHARDFMKITGNPDQWKDGYPSITNIESDISKKSSYVLVDNGVISAVFYFAIENDPTYDIIYNGKWLNNHEYGVIHRIAALSGRKGLASHCINWCFAKAGNIRIDTHRDNRVMRSMLEKNNFEYCGVIHIANGSKRVAYHKIS